MKKHIDTRYKVCLWGSDSPYCWEHVVGLADECDMSSVVIGQAFGYEFDIRIINRFSRRPLSTAVALWNRARIMYLFLKYDHKCDCHLVHYLSPEYAQAIAFLPLRKPTVYCVYGSDVRTPQGIHRRIVGRALRRVDAILAGVTSSFPEKHIVSRYGVDEKRIIPILWYSLGSCFRRLGDEAIAGLRRKWDLTREHVILSPRATKPLYNHHLLIEALGLLDDELKEKIEVVVTGFGDLEYRKRLLQMGEAQGIDVVDLGRILTPEEMAEMYNIAAITPNIAGVADDLGRSTFEAVACGSILLVSKDSGPYQEIFRDGKYCRFVELTPADIARAVEDILRNGDSLRDEEERQRIMDIVNWEKNKRRMVECIKTLARGRRKLPQTI